jgi:hypothetical protein
MPLEEAPGDPPDSNRAPEPSLPGAVSTTPSPAPVANPFGQAWPSPPALQPSGVGAPGFPVPASNPMPPAPPVAPPSFPEEASSPSVPR